MNAAAAERFEKFQEQVFQLLDKVEENSSTKQAHVEKEIAAQVIDACLCDPEASKLISSEQLEWIRLRHANWIEGHRDSVLEGHQMLGVPRNVHSAADTWPHKVCLMQMSFDYGQDWYFGDVGTLQFWMTAQQVVDGDWHEATQTLEG